jgi:hypothetical protein
VSGCLSGAGSLSSADRSKAVNWRRCLVALVILVLAGCAPSAGGSGQPANAPYQQEDPRDTSGMH